MLPGVSCLALCSTVSSISWKIDSPQVAFINLFRSAKPRVEAKRTLRFYFCGRRWKMPDICRWPRREETTSSIFVFSPTQLHTTLLRISPRQHSIAWSLLTGCMWLSGGGYDAVSTAVGPSASCACVCSLLLLLAAAAAGCCNYLGTHVVVLLPPPAVTQNRVMSETPGSGTVRLPGAFRKTDHRRRGGPLGIKLAAVHHRLRRVSLMTDQLFRVAEKASRVRRMCFFQR